MKRIIALLLVCLLVLSCAGCAKKTDTRPPLQKELPGATVSYTFAPTACEPVTLSPEGAAQVTQVVEAQVAQYPYRELYDLEEVEKRLGFDATVTRHAASALNSAGVLESSHLATLIHENNAAFMATKPFGYSLVEDDYIAELCDFIVLVMGRMQADLPELDWERIYCNLGNLKILYDTGMLSFAQVNADMVLSLSKNNTQIVLKLKGENSFSQVMTHELIHVMQIGCLCERIENCERRAGIAVYWEDFDLNSGDWTWLVEGSAERHMCRITGGPAVSYQYKMDYICSFTMALLLREEVAADTMENLCFQADPQLLFDAFGCENRQERLTVLELMTTVNVLQMQPAGFYRAYEKAYGVDPKNDEDAMNEISYSLKPVVCITLAKEFYGNLLTWLQQGDVPANDLFCMLSLFEGHLNQHLGYHVESRAQINAPFMEAYSAMRAALFAQLEAETGMDITAMFAAYRISGGENAICGEFAMLPEAKRTFLLERAQWQAEQNALGTRVP